MKAGRESRKQARRLFHRACPGGKFNPEVAAAIGNELAEERPRGALGTLKEFVRLVRIEVARRHMKIESAVPLEAARAARLENELLARFGPGATSEFRHNPGLIGGLRIQVGSDVWDGSLRGRLARLQQQLSTRTP